ncbi:MAG: enoyl-CoA hydratase/isomerase family protein [Solirubrobacterales bacterium]
MAERLTSFENRDGVGLLRLQRPEARNAMNSAMLEELVAHIAAARADDAVRVLVLASDDVRGLSAGADVREELDRDGAIRRMELFADLYEALVAFPRATVAACAGATVGGGAEAAIACDLRVAGDNLKLRFPGAALGVPVGPARLVTLCGLSVAKDLLLTSRVVGAEEAHRWGLVHRVVEAERTVEAAMELAAEVAQHDPASVAQIKELLHGHDGVLERTRQEGDGQTEFQRSGAGLPYRGSGPAP